MSDGGSVVTFNPRQVFRLRLAITKCRISQESARGGHGLTYSAGHNEMSCWLQFQLFAPQYLGAPQDLDTAPPPPYRSAMKTLLRTRNGRT